MNDVALRTAAPRRQHLPRRLAIGSACAATLTATPAFASNFDALIPIVYGGFVLIGAGASIAAWFFTSMIANKTVRRGIASLAFSLLAAPVINGSSVLMPFGICMIESEDCHDAGLFFGAILPVSFFLLVWALCYAMVKPAGPAYFSDEEGDR